MTGNSDECDHFDPAQGLKALYVEKKSRRIDWKKPVHINSSAGTTMTLRQ
ncbi:hypothetical protein FHW88_000441 [Mucilaginibacter sp. SG538B]|nr:hypothetical protein [Mucilaginibacter sp. SG538B]NVM62165.1 hypothetical protein [Mucilaginibacter sp. SG538B]